MTDYFWPDDKDGAKSGADSGDFSVKYYSELPADVAERERAFMEKSGRMGADGLIGKFIRKTISWSLGIAAGAVLTLVLLEALGVSLPLYIKNAYDNAKNKSVQEHLDTLTRQKQLEQLREQKKAAGKNKLEETRQEESKKGNKTDENMNPGKMGQPDSFKNDFKYRLMVQNKPAVQPFGIRILSMPRKIC